jgi:hypothetical protein
MVNCPDALVRRGPIDEDVIGIADPAMIVGVLSEATCSHDLFATPRT